MERTVALIKPDAVRRHLVGNIITRIEQERFDIRDIQWQRFTLDGARAFYAEHESKSFFQHLVEFMSSGPIVALTLQGADVIAHWRRVMGPAHIANQRPPQLRHMFRMHGAPTWENLVHGSDSPDAYAREVDLIS